MATPKEITATEKLLDLIRTTPPVMEPAPSRESDADPLLQLTLEEVEQKSTVAEGGEGHPHQVAPPPPGPDDSPLVTLPEGEGDEDSSFLPSTNDPPPSAPGAIKTLFPFRNRIAVLGRKFRRLRPSAKSTIAIDIQPGMIHLVRTQTDKGGCEILDCRSVPYGLDPDSRPKDLYADQSFIEALFRSLSSFVPRHGRHEIWCSYFFCNPVALHNISIPKVGEQDLANAVFWSAKRELEFDEKEALFDYSLLQELPDGGQPKIQTLVTLVPRQEVEGVSAMFKDAGFPLTGLTFPAAAIQNFLNQDQSLPPDNPVVYFTVRRNSSFIDLYHQGKMFFSREIKTGADSFVESLLDQALSRNILIDEEWARESLFRAPGRPGQEARPGHEELLAGLDFGGLPVIDRLVRQLVRTFEYCGTTFKLPAVGKIFTSGEYTVNDTILQAIAERVGIKCAVIEPLSPAIFNRTCEISAANTTTLLVAAGLSLSERETTANFLFTYAERNAETATNRVNTIIAIATICLTLGCGALFAWQYHLETGKQQAITALRNELDRQYLSEPRSRSNDYAEQTTRKIGQFHRDNQEKVKRFKTVIMLNEVAKGVDRGGITLTDLTLELDRQPTESRTDKEESASGLMKIHGYIDAPPENQEFILMHFLKDLSRLSLLTEPDLRSKERTLLQGQDVLRFEVTLKTTKAILEPPPS